MHLAISDGQHLDPFPFILKGCQHAIRPHRRFCPSPLLLVQGFSGLLRLSCHSRWCLFLLYGLHSSTSLSPFAPSAVRRTSLLLWRLCLLIPSLPISGIPDSCAMPSCHSVSNHPLLPTIAFARYPSAWQASRPRRVWASPFPNRLAITTG